MDSRMLELFPEWATLSPRRQRIVRKRNDELEAYVEKHPFLEGIYDPNVVNTIIAPKSQAAADSSRNFSTAVWGSCPWDSLKNDSRLGFTFEDDFVMTGNAVMSSAYTASIGQWTAYGYAGSIVQDGQLEGGVIKIGSDGDNEGTTLLSSTGAFRFVTTSTLAANRRMWYESRWARSSVTTVIADYFVGLMAPGLTSGLPIAAQPITATDDTLASAATTNLFGFHSTATAAVRGGPTEIAAAFVLASGTVNYPTNLTTMMASSGNSVLTAGGYVKTGFIFDPNGPFRRITSAANAASGATLQTVGQVKRAVIRFFINNLELPAFLTADNVLNATATQAFPTAFMAPCFSVMNTAGTATNTLNADWVRVAQEANS